MSEIGRDDAYSKIAAANLGALLYDGDESIWWWLSFADGTLPEGSQFLGACLVAAPTDVVAVARAHHLGINPGGEVMMWGPFKPEDFHDDYPRHRLMSREEIDEWDREADA